MLTLALIGRRSLNYEKRVWNSTASEPAKSDPCSLPHLKKSGVLPLDKIMKMDHDNLRKKSAMASFLTNQT